MRATFLSLVLAVLATTAHAAPEADPVDAPRWAALSTDERSVLAPLQSSWEGMEPESRQKWRQIARRFPDMPASRQERVRERMNDWAGMTREQRVLARQTFTRTKGLSREERRAQWEAYQALTPEERAALSRSDNPPGRTAPPGATTRLQGAPAEPPAYVQSGMPKINVMPGMVDRTTLLPLRGPQGAAQVKPAEPANAGKKPSPKKP